MPLNRRAFTRSLYAAGNYLFWGIGVQSCKHESFEAPVPEVELLNLLGDEALYSSDPFSIKWRSKNISSIHIEFSKDGGIGWEQIFSSIPADLQEIEWDVPLINSDKCLLRIVNPKSNSVLFESNPFSIIKIILRITVGDYPALEDKNQLLFFNFGHVSIQKISKEEFIVLRPICSHEICELDWLKDEKTLVCPCHGSRFSTRGDRLSGLAEKDLQLYSYQYFSDTDRLYVLGD